MNVGNLVVAARDMADDAQVDHDRAMRMGELVRVELRDRRFMLAFAVHDNRPVLAGTARPADGHRRSSRSSVCSKVSHPRHR